MLPLGSIFRKHEIAYHCFADDPQLFFPLHPVDKSCATIVKCLEDEKSWMAKNRLHLNESKTYVVVFGPLSSSSPLISSYLGPLSRNVHPYTKI